MSKTKVSMSKTKRIFWRDLINNIQVWLKDDQSYDFVLFLIQKHQIGRNRQNVKNTIMRTRPLHLWHLWQICKMINYTNIYYLLLLSIIKISCILLWAKTLLNGRFLMSKTEFLKTKTIQFHTNHSINHLPLQYPL